MKMDESGKIADHRRMRYPGNGTERALGRSETIRRHRRKELAARAPVGGVPSLGLAAALGASTRPL